MSSRKLPIALALMIAAFGLSPGMAKAEEHAPRLAQASGSGAAEGPGPALAALIETAVNDGRAGWLLPPDRTDRQVLVDQRGCLMLMADGTVISRPYVPQKGNVSAETEYLRILRGPVFEHAVPHMYLSPEYGVLVGAGFALPTAAAATELPFHLRTDDGKVVRAKKRQIVEAYIAVRRNGRLAGEGPAAFDGLSSVFMTPEDVDAVLAERLKAVVDEVLLFNQELPNFRSYPIPAQMALLDIVYYDGIDAVLAMAPLVNAVGRRDWRGAGEAQTAGPGRAERKERDRQWFLEAEQTEPFFFAPGCTTPFAS